MRHRRKLAKLQHFAKGRAKLRDFCLFLEIFLQKIANFASVNTFLLDVLPFLYAVLRVLCGEKVQHPHDRPLDPPLNFWGGKTSVCAFGASKTVDFAHI